MEKRVKILVNDDGEKEKFTKWHLVAFGGDTERTLCDGQAFDGSTEVVYKVEYITKNKKVTCEDCIQAIKFYKSIKL